MLAKSLFADEYVLYFSWLNPHVGEMLNPNVAASTPPCPGTLLGLTSFFSDQRPWVSWIVPIMLTIAALLKKNCALDPPWKLSSSLVQEQPGSFQQSSLGFGASGRRQSKHIPIPHFWWIIHLKNIKDSPNRKFTPLKKGWRKTAKTDSADKFLARELSANVR